MGRDQTPRQIRSERSCYFFYFFFHHDGNLWSEKFCCCRAVRETFPVRLTFACAAQPPACFSLVARSIKDEPLLILVFSPLCCIGVTGKSAGPATREDVLFQMQMAARGRHFFYSVCVCVCVVCFSLQILDANPPPPV